MIVAAAICPSPPLLASGITGQAEILPDLRAACAAAVARLLAAVPDVVAVVGPADATAAFDPAAELSLAAYAPALHRAGPIWDNSKKRDAGLPAASASPLTSTSPSVPPLPPASALPRASALPPAPDSPPVPAAPPASVSALPPAPDSPPVPAPPPASALPLALGIGALLLDEAGYQGPRAYEGVAEHEPAAACLALGAKIAASAPRVALLAMGDGTARRSPSAPGYLDERAAPFDEAVERAVRTADLAALAALDPALAADLLAVGRPAWQSLAGALSSPDPGGAGLRTEILYSGAPLGVAYLVATLIPQ
jgi:hypothetical protein